MKRMFHSAVLLCALSLASTTGAQDREQVNRLARDIFKQLIEINTTDSVGNVTTAAEAMAKRLRDAGFPEKDIAVVGINERKKNLIARIHGTGKQKPLLLLAHLDVVEARREDWTTDPFQFVEKDGYFYGRGTQDIKDGDAILVANFLRWKKEGLRPDRDLILALTSGEESGIDNGVAWLVRNHRELIEAEYCINTDGGDFQSREGRPEIAAIQASEKLSIHYVLEVTNRGGHSSLPVPDNAIYHLADGLSRIERYRFPTHVNEVTRAFFARASAGEAGHVAADLKAVSQDPPDPDAVMRLSTSAYYNALLHTTCVATRLEGGHANNALPQMARAVVNCRILPGETGDEVLAALQKIVADPQIKISYLGEGHGGASPSERVPGAPSPLRADVVNAVEKTVNLMWPGVRVLPTMEAGGTDGFYLRAAGIPTYGVSGVFIDMGDVRAHGKDERIRAESFDEGVEFYDRLIKALAAN